MSYVIDWMKRKYLFDLLWLITKFQLVYLCLVMLGDFGNEIIVGLGTIFKIVALGWCGYSIYTYFKNETDLLETYGLSRIMLFTLVMIAWCIEAVIWGNLITKLATMDLWIIPQKGFSVQNLHNGGEYLTMACLLIVVSLMAGLILKALQLFWYPYQQGREEDVSEVLCKIARAFVTEPSMYLGRKVCIIITVAIVLFSIYPILDLFVYSSDNVVNSNKDVVKYFEEEYNLKVEKAEVYRDKKDYKFYRYECKGSENHTIMFEQTYVVPKAFEKGVPRWEISLRMDNKEIKFE